MPGVPIPQHPTMGAIRLLGQNRGAKFLHAAEKNGYATLCGQDLMIVPYEEDKAEIFNCPKCKNLAQGRHNGPGEGRTAGNNRNWDGVPALGVPVTRDAKGRFLKEEG